MAVLDGKLIADSVGIELDERHRALEKKAKSIVDQKIAPHETEDSDEAALSMVRALGEAGLLDPCVELDVPSICVLREVVAHSSGLADSMLALQGLGYGPLALQGTE